ncbi:MAG: CoB--CoM heterodisulfide reductase iron-sulfur subunit C [Candidatus Bathyarchaeota archaeon BA1]|nr:MAG: CoB--CoM heterodisulfide reductase iron-sulfur subunit C [Candidatus Bathyarchaeota archaeon BA1]
MTITDLMTSKKTDAGLRLKVLGKIGDHKPYQCYLCVRCTSGCPSMKMLEIKPHEIVSLVKLGFIEEAINSGIIWICAMCLKCKERCPQEVAPVDLILALRNLAVELEAKIPEGHLRNATTILETGFILRPQEAITRRLEKLDRDKLGLPKLPKPSEEFKATLLKALETF